MNVNGARFDLLLGRADWARCLDGDDVHARPLGESWDRPAESPPEGRTGFPPPAGCG